ncbi:MAG: hypothetical protein HRT63_03570 [Erythrobacter sp.]|nr:hypothetical protein [Erythrobacter sp.]
MPQMTGDPITSVDPDTQTGAVVFEEVEERQKGEERVSVFHSRTVQTDGDMDAADLETVMIAVRQGLDEARRSLEFLPQEIEKSLEGVEDAEGRAVIVEMACDDTGEVSSTSENAEGAQVVRICRTQIVAEAVEGLREAREDIASETDLDPKLREMLLRELDQQIKAWEGSRG